MVKTVSDISNVFLCLIDSYIGSDSLGSKMGGGKRDAAEGKESAHAPIRAIHGAIEGQMGTGRGAYHVAEM